MAEKLTSIKIVLENLMNHPLLQDLTIDRAISYAVDFVRTVGVPAMFSEKVAHLKVDKYRAELPCDFVELQQISGSRLHHSHPNQAMRQTTDSFFMDRVDEPERVAHNSHLGRAGISNSDPTYKIQNDMIYVSYPKGDLTISYTALETDEDGFPLIPDNSIFTTTLELYIKKQYFTILFDIGKITGPVLKNTQQEYYASVLKLESEINRPSIGEMESLANMWTAVLSRNLAFQEGFRHLGTKERLWVKR